MPSLWKKHKGGGSRISRLVADLQTPPKRGGSLVVETGFPTSLVDLFVKNRDRLRKPSKKKIKTTKQSSSSSSSGSVSTVDAVFVKVLEPTVVSDSSGSSVDEICKHNVSNGVGENDRRELGELKRANEISFVSSSDGDEVVVEGGGNVEFSGSGSGSDLSLSVWLNILKGALVVIVAFSTKRFVVGITLGALLLMLLEYVGNAWFMFLKPCGYDRFVLRWFGPSSWVVAKLGRADGERNERKVRKGVLKRAVGISPKREGEGNNHVASKMEVAGEGGIEVVSRRQFKLVDRDCGFSSKREVEEEVNLWSLLSREDSESAEDEVVGNPVRENEVLESMNSECDPDGCCDLRKMKRAVGVVDSQGNEFKMNSRKEKTSKGRKFWKKLVPKHMNKRKKNKHGKEKYQTCGEGEFPYEEEMTTEFVVEDEQEEVEEEMVEVELSSLISSSTSDGAEEVERSTARYPEMVQDNKRTMSSIGIIMQRGGKLTWLAVMVIALAGLVRGRIFALVVTVICCMVFRKLRK